MRPYTPGVGTPERTGSLSFRACTAQPDAIVGDLTAAHRDPDEITADEQVSAGLFRDGFSLGGWP